MNTRSPIRVLGRRLLAVGLLWLAGCGGGGGGGGSSGSDIATKATLPPTDTATELPPTRAEAARFLAQATFGPTEADIARVMSIGYSAWIDEQFAMSATSHRASWDATDAALKAANPADGAGQEQVLESFWTQVLVGPDQLRLRVAYALSQILVISMAEATLANEPRAAAAWLDVLGNGAFGNYRALLESVSLHPLMGMYLSHLRNRKADPASGSVPDENFAREVMQLFSIGLQELNEDGSLRAGGIDTYGPADVSGLARVFTGWSLACPAWPSDTCFATGASGSSSDPDRMLKAMVAYPQFHSGEAKRFLGITVAPQSVPDPAASLKAALDALAAHSNVGPFIGRQLIQRLVSSNPSPAYVRAVARAFADNGQGVRGDLKAVIRAVLLNPEARQLGDTRGKLREPVLRMSAFLRAFPHRSDSGRYRVGNTDSAMTGLGQTPLRSPSVFNFYRPSYVPPGTGAARAALVVPEMQLAHETSVAGYVNFMRDNLLAGVGRYSEAMRRRDLQGDYSAELALADTPSALVEHVAFKLTYGTAPPALTKEISAAVATITVPPLDAPGSSQAVIDRARQLRVFAAILLVLAAPEFQVQK